MISSNFSFGEQSKIASAYATMYAPKRVNESCCKSGGCEEKEAVAKKVAVKCGTPKKTGSKLGRRPVMPLKKRDAKSSAKKFAPKVKVVESAPITTGYCIVDGEKTLCTSDIGESYFNKSGIVGETRIYESAIAALNDIKKVKARRKANKKYAIKKCECVGESFQFSKPSKMVNEGLWDGLKSIGGGLVDGVKAVGNAAGGTLKAAGNLAQGNFSQAGSDFIGGMKDAGKNVMDAGKGVVGGAADATLGTAQDALASVGGVAKAAGNALQGDFSQAGEELKSAGTEALRAVGGDNAAEIDVTGAAKAAGNAVVNGAKAAGNAIVDGAKTAGGAVADGASKVADMAKTAGGAIANGAKETAKAAGNTAASIGNAVGGTLKAAGNLAQGDGGQALADFKSGIGMAVDSAKAAGNNIGNAATNTNDAEKAQAAQAAQATKAPTPEQQKAAASGAGPVSDEAAKKINAQGQSANDVVKQTMAQVNQFMPDAVKDVINSQNAAAGANNAVEQQRKQIQAQIEQLQKQLASLGQ